MDGSGLKELFSVVYAASFVDKLLSGHVYVRTQRAHILAYAALAAIIQDETDLYADEQPVIEFTFLGSDCTQKANEDVLKSALQKFNTTLNS
ncbi:hypothetical protein PR048_014740 [Dryococelus australis]|uniref:Uncharacterized protein n=1 Tax=Dryococelus australis TaxID=614101 RepID=A0ABQ9HFF9_9NEOP|nr:hypothetical protein PR048_014740 [Dryococelus australis]